MTQDRWLRRTALAAVLGNIAFDAFIPLDPERYDNLFSPTPLWGPVSLVLLGYTLFALRDSQRRVTAHDRIALPLTVAAVLQAGWTAATATDQIGLGLLLMFLLLGTGISMFRHALRLQPRAAAIPFSLTLGWLSVATIANVFTWVVASGLRGTAPGEPFYAVAALALAGSIALWLNRRFESLVHPLVVAWAAFGIAFAHRNDSLPVHLSALAVGVVLVTWVAVAAVTPRRRTMMRRPAYLR